MALTREQKANRQKMLDFIAWSEGADYDSIVGLGKGIPGAPATFTDFSRHPRIIGMRTADGDSTAAGRYQITGSTYDDLRKRYNFPETFSPAMQDEMATRLIQQSGALPLVDAGDFRGAINKLGGIWASLPSSKYGQPKHTWDEAMRYLQDYAPEGMPMTASSVPTGDEPNLLQRTGMSKTQQMYTDMLQEANAAIDEYEKQAAADLAALEKQKVEEGAAMERGFEGTRQQIMEQPVQEERGVGSRMIGSLLGGATQKGIESEEDLRHRQLQKRHEDLTNLAIERTKRLADAYIKTGDYINGVKATAAAQKLLQAQKDKADLARTALLASAGEAKAGAKPVHQSPADYAKAVRESFAQFTDKSGNITNPDALRTNIAKLRHSEHTPLTWFQEMVGLIPRKDAFFPWNRKEPFFDIKDKRHLQVLSASLDALFTPEELANKESGLVKIFEAIAGGPPPGGGGGDTTKTAPPQTSDVNKLRDRMNEILKELATTRKAATSKGFLNETIAEQGRKRIDALVTELNQLKKALDVLGYGVVFPDVEARGLKYNEE